MENQLVKSKVDCKSSSGAEYTSDFRVPGSRAFRVPPLGWRTLRVLLCRTDPIDSAVTSRTSPGGLFVLYC